MTWASSARRYSLGTTLTNLGTTASQESSSSSALRLPVRCDVLFEELADDCRRRRRRSPRARPSPCCSALEVGVFVEHEGDAAAHAGREVAAGGAEDDDDAAGHVLAAVIADALDDGDRAAVAHREALAGAAVEEGPAAGGAVEDHVADDDLVVGAERRLAVRADGEDAAREPLADVVVGVAFELERHARRREGAEALPRAALDAGCGWCRRASPLRPYLRAISPLSMAPKARSELRIWRLDDDRRAVLDGVLRLAR